jgi:hypothetical protein
MYNFHTKNMQITRPRGEYVEKIIRDANGQLVRVSFCVYEKNGHIKARLLNVVYVEEKSIADKTILLNFSSPGEEKYQEVVFENKIVSPYFNKNLLYFSGSKPRAPTR